MARTQGTFTLPANVETYAAAPLDARDRVATKNDLTAEGSFPYPWIGMETYVVSENKKYRLIGANPTVLANWEEVGNGGSGASDLEDLDDVNIASVSDGQILKYDSNSSKWVNTNPPASISDLDDLYDVNILNPNEGQVLKYDSSSDTWVNAEDNGGGHTIINPSGTSMTDRSGLKFAGDSVSVSDDSTNDQTIVTMPNLMAAADISEIINPLPDPVGTPDLEDLGDVNISSASNGQVLKYDSSSSKWINAAESGGGASDLNDLDDVNIASATDGQILKYDAANDQWINANEEGGTTVVANPSGTATTDLSKLQVGNDIYGIPTPPSDIDDLSDVEFTSLTNGQILKYDSTASKWVNADESSSAGGHIIENASGTDMTQRTNLQFTGDSISLSDDSTNDRTVVAMPNLMAAADITEIIDPLPDPVGTPDLDELGDVNISSVTNGQVLKYDSASSKWINANESGGGASDLDDLGDVNITSPTSGQVLKYDSQNQEWINANDEGGTTVVANPSGTATADLAKLQVGTDIYGVPDTDELSELTDVNITSVANGQVLKYDSTSSKWVNANESGGSGHTIENASGTDMTARANLQFTGGAVSVSDDSTNDRTVVTVPDVMASTDMSEIISPLPMPAATPDLEDLGDININTPTNGQVLKYDSQNQEWINANESGGGGAGGHTIEDGTGTSMTERASLQFKGAAQVSDDSTNDRTVVEVPKMTSEDLEDILTPLPSPVTTPEVGELSDVNLTSLANGQVLKYDSQNQEWINANESGGASDLEDLEDVNISALSDGQILKYDATNQEWINANESGGTTVVANPTGTPTGNLNSIQIGTNIYNIVGGSGSGGGMVALDTTERTALNTSFELSDSISNYDAILVNIYYTGGSGYPVIGSTVLSVAELADHSYQAWIDGGNNDRALRIEFTDSTHYQIGYSNGDNGVHGVYGLKFGGGSSQEKSYSTTEQVIGTWIDGKPIYRIVLDYSSNPFTGSTTIDVTNLHIDKLIFSDAMGSDSRTYGSDIWTLNSVSGASSRMIYMTDINTLKVTGSYYKDWIILEYTKSTDNI